jgi:hypothetical protein
MLDTTARLASDALIQLCDGGPKDGGEEQVSSSKVRKLLRDMPSDVEGQDCSDKPLP